MPGQWGEFEEGCARVYEGSYAAERDSRFSCGKAYNRTPHSTADRTYSRGSILPRALCLSLAFSGPPLSIFACSCFSEAITVAISAAFSLNSGFDVSTAVGKTEIEAAWWA
jgi:hypothetical protein